MYQQDVKGKKISSLAGLGLILLIVVSIMTAGFVEQVIAQLTGGSLIGSLLVWGLAAAEVFFLLRLGVKEYRYTLAEDRLFIEARYGDSTRIIYDIDVSAMLAIGPENEIFAKYANGQTYDKVFTKGCPVAPSVLAYRKGEETKLLLFQPDEKLLGLLGNRISKEEE